MRVLSFILFSLTVSLGLAIPTSNPAVEKRASPASVEAVITTLQTSTNSIVPQINSLSSSGNANDATVAPVLDKLILAFTTASSSLSNIGGLSARQTDESLAALFSGIISTVSLALEVLLTSADGIPVIGPLLDSIDLAINGLLVDLDVILVGITVLISGILVDLAIVLQGIGLVLVLGTLGL